MSAPAYTPGTSLPKRPRALLAVLVMSAVAAPLQAQGTGVVINGTELSRPALANLLVRHGLPATSTIPRGRYWYDAHSGLWGQQGGPAQGQLLAGLPLGEVASNASGGGTGVFLNGREIHVMEAAYLRSLFGYVQPGRYWMNPQGIGGSEGGPPSFNLAAAAAASRQPSMGGGYDGYVRRTPFGSYGTDGSCSYVMTPDGSSVMTGNC